MMKQIYYYESLQNIPYDNIALEEYLLMNVQPDECILYLWQNKHTVVIGRNQNVWKECKTAELEADRGYLARRLSGGGAVFHDLGNLNFTFLARKANYNVERQLEVILRAVQKLGIKAEKSGRNDITVNGAKFSGNAFYSTKDYCYHHGTVLFNVDKDNLSKYLNVSKAKLQSKGVSSVRSRIANLRDFNPDITLEQLREKMIEAFGEVYGFAPQKLEESRLDKAAIQALSEKFSSRDWLYGAPIKFSYEVSKRFDWGEIELQMEIGNGKVLNTAVYSDSLHPHFISAIPDALNGTLFSSSALANAIDAISLEDGVPPILVDDIKNLLLEQSL